MWEHEKKIIRKEQRKMDVVGRTESLLSQINQSSSERSVFTGGKRALTLQAHGEFIVSSETIRVHGEYFQKVPTCLPQFYPPGPW